MTLMEAEVRSLRHDKLQLEQQVTVMQNNLTQNVELLRVNVTEGDRLLSNELNVLETTHNRDNATLTRMIHGKM
mgnify:CR=1 FL=1